MKDYVYMYSAVYTIKTNQRILLPSGGTDDRVKLKCANKKMKAGHHIVVSEEWGGI